MLVFKRVGHVFLLTLVPFVLAMLYVRPLSAQEGPEELRGQEFGNYNLETGFIVKAYASTDPTKTHLLFLTPFFAFEADENGKLVVRLDEPDSHDGRRRVTIYLLAYPERQKEVIANRIQADEQRLVPQGRFANVRPNELITLGLRGLSTIPFVK